MEVRRGVEGLFGRARNVREYNGIIQGHGAVYIKNRVEIHISQRYKRKPPFKPT